VPELVKGVLVRAEGENVDLEVVAVLGARNARGGGGGGQTGGGARGGQPHEAKETAVWHVRRNVTCRRCRRAASPLLKRPCLFAGSGGGSGAAADRGHLAGTAGERYRAVAPTEGSAQGADGGRGPATGSQKRGLHLLRSVPGTT
jgi:hypothetical protein